MDNNDKEETLISHLEALRSTLIRCFAAIGIVLPFAFSVSPRLLDFLIQMLISGKDIKLNYFAPMEVFILQIKLALLLSVVITFPYIAKQIWDFVLPALYENEKKFIAATVRISSLLFLCGAVFCLFVILPLIVGFGMSFRTEFIAPMWGAANLINLALGLAFVFGLMFQIPIVTYMLISRNIISYETLASKRPYVVTCLLIAAALMTPPDIISQIMLFTPTYMLFETGLLFSKIRRGKNAGKDSI